MSKCVAVHCNNNSKGGFQMLTFPRKLKMREAWIRALKRCNWKYKRGDRLCEVHFRCWDWISFRRKLKDNAVPTVFCACAECIVEPVSSSKKRDIVKESIKENEQESLCNQSRASGQSSVSMEGGVECMCELEDLANEHVQLTNCKEKLKQELEDLKRVMYLQELELIEEQYFL